MNTTTRTAFRLLVATPLAAAALTLGAGVAQADGENLDFKTSRGVVDPKGPGEIANPEPEKDPKPQGPGEIAIPEGEDDPKPQGPGDIANPEGEDDPKPQGPGDIANPEGEDDPDGPGDIANPEPEDGFGGPDDLANPQPGDQPEDKPADKDGDKPAGKGGDKDVKQGREADRRDAAPTGDVVELPTRIDAGAASAEDDGLQLAWLLAGGGLVTAAGSIVARQRMVGRRTR